MTDTALLERRARLIDTLRAGTYDKATGSLCVFEDEWDEGLEEYVVTGVEGYCCIGVALKSEFDISDKRLGEDDSDDYDEFMAKYEISERVKDWLVSMNDGDPRPGKSVSGNREIRTHPFIARFLEILWALENQEN